jgi:hypothetical protein
LICLCPILNFPSVFTSLCNLSGPAYEAVCLWWYQIFTLNELYPNHVHPSSRVYHKHTEGKHILYLQLINKTHTDHLHQLSWISQTIKSIWNGFGTITNTSLHMPVPINW